MKTDSVDLPKAPSALYVKDEDALLRGDFIDRPKDAAAFLNVARQTLHRWAVEGLIEPPIRLGARAVGWRRSTLEAFLKRRQQEGSKSVEPAGGKTRSTASHEATVATRPQGARRTKEEAWRNQSEAARHAREQRWESEGRTVRAPANHEQPVGDA